MSGISLGLTEKLDYILLSEMIDVQEFLDLVKEEGVYELYETKYYKNLTKELMYGVYLVLLTNIRLHREYKKTGNKVTKVLTNHKDEDLFTCEVTLNTKIQDLGTDRIHEFLDYIMREYVKFYKECSVGNIISEESILARRSYIKYPPEDINYLLVLLRGYYGRYSGKEEFDVMVRSMVDELDNVVKTDGRHSLNMSHMNVNLNSLISRGAWWQSGRVVNGRSTWYSYGFTARDKEVAELEFRKMQKRNRKSTN